MGGWDEGWAVFFSYLVFKPTTPMAGSGWYLPARKPGFGCAIGIDEGGVCVGGGGRRGGGGRVGKEGEWAIRGRQQGGGRVGEELGVSEA